MLRGEYRTDRTPFVEPRGIDWQAADMTATFGAAVTAPELAGHQSLWLPMDFGEDRNQQLGQLVARNSTGPLRLGFGAWRDLLLGCQFEDGAGRLVTVGGKTMKNVAGYDLTKFMVGQGEVFGRILTVTTRVYLKPTDALLAEFEPRMETFNRLIASPCRPQWAILRVNALWCGYLGQRRTIEYHAKQLSDWQPRQLQPHDLPADIDFRCKHWRVANGEGLVMRASVPPMKIQEFALRAQLNDWAADAAFGVVFARVEATRSDAVADAAKEVRGRAWFWDRDGERLSRYSPSAAERTILERLKRAFDPESRLAPLPWS